MRYPLSVALLATLALPAHADTRLKPIITASRVAQTADQTLAAVTVLTEADIDKTQSDSLPEVLRLLVPGLDFSTTGGTGHQVSAFLRGTSSDNVLVLIDGNIIGSATTGATALELIPVQQIDRIEVVRGPRSALYGSDAIGGVIQVFTRNGTVAGADAGNAAITLGSNGTHAAEASLGMSSENSRLVISANHLQTDGFDVTADNETDDDGYTNSSFNINLSHQLAEQTKLHARFLHADGETEFDNLSFDNVSDSIQQSANIGIESKLMPAWDSSFELGQTRDKLETRRNSEDFFSPGVFNFEKTLFDTRRQQARWLNRLSFNDTGLASIGVDYLDDEVESTTNYAVDGRDNRGLYALIQDKFGNHQLQLSGRVDDNEAFGTHRTSGAAWSYDITGAVRTSLSRSTAFIAPTFNDLYFVDPFFVGNPNLDPETSATTELGLIGNQHWGSWELRIYQTDIENLIINVSSNPSDPFAAFTTTNANKAEIEGAEFVLGAELAGWDNNASFSYVDAVNLSSDTQLQNRARRSLKLRSSNTLRGHQLTIDVLAQSSRFADVANSRSLAGYGIMNIAVARPVHKDWSLKLKIENLFDKEYSTSQDFFGNNTNNTPRSFFVTLSYLR